MHFAFFVVVEFCCILISTVVKGRLNFSSGTLQGTSCRKTHARIAPKLPAPFREHRCEEKHLSCRALCSGHGREGDGLRPLQGHSWVCPGQPEGARCWLRLRCGYSVCGRGETHCPHENPLPEYYGSSYEKERVFPCAASQITVLVRTRQRVSHSAVPSSGTSRVISSRKSCKNYS